MSTKRRASTNGFSRANMADMLASIKRYSAEWRRVDMKKMVMTVLHQTFLHTSGASSVIQHICPWGMRAVISQLLTHDWCLMKNVIPTQVKDDHPLLMETYNKGEWEVSVSNIGPQDPMDYHRLYCTYCHKHLIPKLLEGYKDLLGDAPSVENLINT